jgi:Exoribonuclease R
MRRREQYASRKSRQDGNERRGQGREKSRRRNGPAADAQEPSGRRAASRLTGRFSVQRSGVGFVLPDSDRGGDIFVHASNFGEAWHGDRVEVTLLARRGRNREGVITAVLKRGRETVTAEIMRSYGKNRWLARPLDSRLDFAFLADLPKESENVLDSASFSPTSPAKAILCF